MNLLHIGTTEFVSLPDDQIYDVPAKVDTGADNSAIWASNIHLNKGKLLFNFFAPGSVFYSERPVVSSAYRTTSVRNSFGDKEFRYKIKLRVTIGDHTLTRWFTLADRSQNNYPILLGKNFLKNKFIVDVAQKYIVGASGAPTKVVILGAQSTKSREFFREVQKQNKLPLAYSCASYKDLMYYIGDQQGTHVLNMADKGSDLASYSYAYFKSHARYPELAAAAAEYLHFRGRQFIDHEVGNYTSTSKLTEYMKLACFGLPIPASICAMTNQLAAHYEAIVVQLGLPFVLKEIYSNRGENNYLINREADFRRLLKMASSDYTFLAQQYIPNDGFYRIYVLGKNAELAVWRTPHSHKVALKAHLNKPRGSVNASLVPVDELPGAVQDIAIRAANCLDRQMAGIDMIQHNQTEAWYVLEVNNAPQIRSGSFMAEKKEMIARFFDKELS